MIEQHKSLAEKFLKKGFWLYLFSFIIAPIGYIIKIIVSGELTVSEVGILYGILSLVGLISVYNDLGMSESLNHFVPKFVTKKEYSKVKSILFYALFIQIITSVIISCFFYFGADFIANSYFKTDSAKGLLKIFAFYFIGLNIIQTIIGFFNAVQDTFSRKIVEFIRSTFIMISILYVYFGDISSIINYSYGWLIGLYTGILFSLILFYNRYYKKYFVNEKIIIEKKLIKKITKYALIVFVGAGAGTILGQMDMQMIIYILDTTDAGYYTNYLSIIGIPFMIIGPIFGLLFPIFSELHSKKEYKKIKLAKNIFTKIFLLLGIMFNVFLFIFAEIIAFTLFGEKFINSGTILKYSVLLLVFNFLLQINFNIMAGIGKVSQRVKIIFIALGFNFIMNLILIKSIGVYGAALATGFGWILIWGLSEYFLGKKYKIDININSVLKNIFLIGFLGIIVNKLGLNIFEGIGRINSFLLLGGFFIIWFGIFIIINYNEFSLFILEVKKLKKGTK